MAVLSRGLAWLFTPTGWRVTYIYFPPAVLTVCALITAVVSLGWPNIWDPPVFHYMGWRFLSGDVPYVDVFDVNMPGTYLLHMFLVGFFGAGDFALRVFDLVWLCLTAFSAALFCGRFGRPAAILAAIFIFALHLASGYIVAAKAEFVMSPLTILGLHFLAHGVETNRQKRNFLLAGLLIGGALIIKPFIALLIVLLAGLYLASAYKALKTTLGHLLVFIGAALIAPAGVALWLALLGALGPFYHLVTGYLPLYNDLAQLGLIDLTKIIGKSVAFVLYPALIMLPLMSGSALRSFRFQVLLAGLVYALALYYLQRKGWTNHQIPVQDMSLILGAVVFGSALKSDSGRLRAVGAVAVCVVCLFLSFKCVRLAGTDMSRVFAQDTIVPMLVEDIKRVKLAPGDTVQVLDSVTGGIHALLKLKLKQPTRFIYDFVFYYNTDSKLVRGMRAEFMKSLTARPPRLIVLAHSSMDLSEDRVKRFPALNDLLGTKYRIIKRHTRRGSSLGYTLYILKKDK